MERLPLHHHRRGLARTRRALARGGITVGFVGGSITDQRPRCNWPEPVAAWFVEAFPGVRLAVENAAIGATGSDLAVFRAQRDLIERGCDLVFIEFAVNDGGEPAEKRMRTREGLVRKLLAGEGRDLVITYTYAQDMYADMAAGRVPATIAEFETLAEHYDIGSVWMGLHALREVMAGQMRWEEWLPDGLHPQQRGSLSYGQGVTAFLETELRQPRGGRRPGAAGRRLPAPLNPRHWQAACALPFSAVSLSGPWIVRRHTGLVWMDQVLETAAPGAKLSFTFTGRGLALGFDFGRSSAEFRYSLDGGEWLASRRDRPGWCGNEGWYRLFTVAEELAPAPHRFELEVVHGNQPDCTGTNFRLALIGVIP
ncbi:MAG: hypothetical protein BWZ02_03175 [Lentisphaerae bacterium ADurb.BinA184]|nr:MAG: hypothetical protein BWZ02_03175 [Lentisphaerae bacterium ADurb.BinA184]